MPMQRGKCPACGADIGGQNHRSVSGVRDAKANPMMDLATHLGYQFVHGENVGRVEHYTATFIRLIVNSCLFTSLVIPNGSPEGVSKLIRHPNDDKLRNAMMNIVGRDFDDLVQRNRLDSMLTGVLLNAGFCLITDKSKFWIPGNFLCSKEPITPLEKVANEAVRAVMTDIQNTIKHRVDSSWQASQREKILQRSLGQEMWDGLLESFLPPTQIWRYIPPVSMDHFTMATSSIDSFEERYPLLGGFMENENRLELVQCIIAILEWHRLLFSVFQNNELTREQARDITNADVLKRLHTEEEHERGQRVLHNFCKAFNQSFPIVDLIYECKENKFLTENGEVDLSMSGVATPMSPETPIFFSLPNATEAGQGIDTPTYCTIQLLLYLHRIHEGALGIGNERQQRRRREEGGDGPAAAARPGTEIAPDVILPVISCDTPTRTLRQKLILYGRQQDLIPLLTTFSSVKEGTLEYDFPAIQNYLRSGVLGGKQSTRLYIKQYQYQGDLRAIGGVGRINSRVPQSVVSDSILQLILTEVDTQNRITELMSKLEIVVQFVTTVGGSAVRGMELERTMLRDYAIDTLQIPADDWDKAVPASVNEHIRLCHLRSLFMSLEEKMSGTDEVPQMYQEELLPSAKDELLKHLDLNPGNYAKTVVPTLRDFIRNELVGKGVQNPLDPELNFKIIFADKIESDEDYEWFDGHFPDLFMMKNCVALYDLLASRTKS